MRVAQIIVVDDFLDDPDGVRSTALAQPFIKMHAAGLRTQAQFLHLAPYREQFERLLGRRVVNWDDNDANGRFLALTGAVGDATERHVIGAAGLNVPELNAATIRRGFDTCPIDSRHIGDGGVAQICRKRGEDISA